MILPKASPAYSMHDQIRLRAELEKADGANFKKGQDLEIDQARIILRDSLTGARYALDVTAGVLTAVAV